MNNKLFGTQGIPFRNILDSADDTSISGELDKSLLSTYIANRSTFGNSFVCSTQKVRRTDEKAQSLPLNWPRSEASYIDVHTKTSLYKVAHSLNISGVYILYLFGEFMKAGSAEIGVTQRMSQYYNLNRFCGLPYITETNREDIQVVWQACPKSKCIELESKLSIKYGKGPWSQRTPHSTFDTWELLI